MHHDDESHTTTNRAAANERAVTASGDPERPAPRLRKIDCFGNPEITDRRVEHRGARHHREMPRAG